MPRSPRPIPISTALVVAFLITGVPSRGPADSQLWCRASGSSPFLEESQAAMERMMTGMEAPPSGDADRDFAAQMIPHHQGAIEMAQAELRYGHNELLRRIAQGIVVEQQQEIAAMRLALGQSEDRP
jgi:uncharacterized protein (DUF305 family)